MNIRNLAPAALLLTAATPALADEQIAVVGIEINRTPEAALGLETDPQDSMMMHGSDGTNLTLAIAADLPIVDIDTNASDISSFTDDANTDLLEDDSDDDGWGGFSSSALAHSRVSDDGSFATVQLHGPSFPDPDATRLHAQGTIALMLAEGVNTRSFENITVDGDEIQIDEHAIEVSDDEGGGGWGGGFGFDDDDQTVVVLSMPQTLGEQIAAVRFLDADGQEIQIRSTGTFTGMNEATREYTLDREIDAVDIEIDLYEQIERRDVTLDLQIGLGLQ